MPTKGDCEGYVIINDRNDMVITDGGDNMRQWLEQWRAFYTNWMKERYGKDELNQFLLLVSLILLLASLFFPKTLYLAGIPLIFALYRWYSKDFAKRRQERNLYIRLFEDTVQWFKVQKRKWADRKTHVYFTCEHCKTVFRVPKGKGTIEVTCPKCGDKKIRKS